MSRKVRFDLDRAINKPILLGVADGFRFVQGGLGDEPIPFVLGYFSNSSFAVAYLVPDVGTNPDKGDVTSGEGGVHVRLVAERLGNGKDGPFMRGAFQTPCSMPNHLFWPLHRPSPE